MNKTATRSIALLCCLSVGCGETVSVSRGTFERTVAQDEIARRPGREESQVSYLSEPGRLRLRIVQRRTCEVDVLRHYEVLERIEKKPKVEDWWMLAVVGGVVGLAGGIVIAAAHTQPTQGVDSDNKPTNPRQDAYGIGGVIVALGASLVLVGMPITGTSDVLVSRNSKPETQFVTCGERPFHGRIEILHNGQRLEAHTNTEGEASIDAADLGGMATSERLVVSAPAIGLTTEMVVDPVGAR
jgi:hypothetical protein